MNPVGGCADGTTCDHARALLRPSELDPPNPNWRVLFEWKTGTQGDDGDYRLILAPRCETYPRTQSPNPASLGTGLPACQQRRSDTEKRSIFLEDIHQICMVILEAAERQPCDEARQCPAEDSNESLA